MSSWSFTSESVTEGHPDKVADAISDAVLDASLEVEPLAKVACEVLVTKNLAVIAGEIGNLPDERNPDVEGITRDTIRNIGYDFDPDFSADTITVLDHMNQQSPDIAQGVDRLAGAGDQGLMFGFAVDEADELMPLPIFLAHRLSERLAEVRRTGKLDYLRPDGKTQVRVRYVDGAPVAVEKILISSHHDESVDSADIREEVFDVVVAPVIPAVWLPDGDPEFVFNPSGKFTIGGPVADTGVTGRKIIVDTYGGYARHGGGAFSGKDATKVDRSAAYAARWAAKNVVASGAAQKLEIQLSYAIGDPEPFSTHVETFGTERVDRSAIVRAVDEIFDFRPQQIIDALDLRAPGFARTVAYGHFGRPEFTWERLDRVEDLKSSLGL